MTATMVMASEAILDRKEALAREITQALYDHEPGLLERHGERGRAKCLQDMRYNLEHLAPAVGLDDPALFARYVTWLDQLLRVRGVATDDVRRSIEMTARVISARLPAEQAMAVLPSLDAGISALCGTEPR